MNIAVVFIPICIAFVFALFEIAKAIRIVGGNIGNGSDAERQKVMDKLDALDDDIKSTVKNNLPKMDNPPPPPPPIPWTENKKG